MGQADLGGKQRGPSRSRMLEEERDPGGDYEHKERGKRGTRQ